MPGLSESGDGGGGGGEGLIVARRHTSHQLCHSLFCFDLWQNMSEFVPLILSATLLSHNGRDMALGADVMAD